MHFGATYPYERQLISSTADTKLLLLDTTAVALSSDMQLSQTEGLVLMRPVPWLRFLVPLVSPPGHQRKTGLLTGDYKSSRGTFDHLQDTLRDVRGRVVDENGEPLAGVNVVVKGYSKGTTTNGNGEFALKNVDENAMIQISSVGYGTIEVNVKGKESIISITLNKVLSSLDEVQIIAYGQTTKRFQTGNVSTVKAEDIEKQPVNNPLLALQGKSTWIIYYSDKRSTWWWSYCMDTRTKQY